MVQDGVGNKLYMKGHSIYIKLVSENVSRRIGDLDYDRERLNIIRKQSVHLFRAGNAYGFNDTIIKTATKFKEIFLMITDTDESFIIPLSVFKTDGKYLNFKQQGFELQIFLSVNIINQFKV